MKITGLSNRALVSELVADTPLPRMVKIRQQFPRPTLPPEQIPGKIRELIEQPQIRGKIRPGMRIAITVGSRGIRNNALIVRSIVDTLKFLGASPFIVPAMGSHGGATAEGQRQVVEDMGITQEAMGCPILSSMDVVQIGQTPEGKPVFIDKNAAGADGIIVYNRIKPHTSFRGTYESGLMKMMAIGLGKQHGAEACHTEGFGKMAENIPRYGQVILDNAPVLFAIAVLENAYDETARILTVDAKDIPDEEPRLLREAFTNLPRIPVDSCDVLVVDQIGKNLSGDGMDPNITGTFCTPFATGGIKAQQVAVLDLTDDSHGNAMGIGMSSATTDRLIEKADLSVMYPNAITSSVLKGVRLPVIMPNDREAIQICLKACCGNDPLRPRMVLIKNTLDLEELWLSEAYLDEIRARDSLTILSPPAAIPFDENGNLIRR